MRERRPRATPTGAATGPLVITRKSIGLMKRKRFKTKKRMNGNTKLSSPEIIATQAISRVKSRFFGG
jgi:hypothetical protein